MLERDLINLVYLLSSVPMTTGTVMPINGVFLIKINSGSKVCNSFIILKEAIPDKPTAVISRCVLGI